MATPIMPMKSIAVAAQLVNEMSRIFTSFYCFRHHNPSQCVNSRPRFAQQAPWHEPKRINETIRPRRLRQRRWWIAGDDVAGNWRADGIARHCDRSPPVSRRSRGPRRGGCGSLSSGMVAPARCSRPRRDLVRPGGRACAAGSACQGSRPRRLVGDRPRSRRERPQSSARNAHHPAPGAVACRRQHGEARSLAISRPPPTANRRLLPGCRTCISVFLILRRCR